MKKLSSLILALIWLLIAVILVCFALTKINLKNNSFFSFGRNNQESGMNIGFNSNKNCKTFNFSIDQINKIQIDFSSEEIEVVSSARNDILIEYNGNWTDDIIPFTELNNSVLTITKKERNAFRGSLINPRSVRIDIPNKMDAYDLNLKISSGSVHIEDLVLNTANLKLSSGSLFVENLKLDNIDASSNSGRLGINNITANKGDFQASSGSIKVEDSKISEISTNTSSGSVNLDGSFEGITANTTSGSIRATSVSPLIYDSSLNSTSGSIHLSIPESTSYNLDYSTTSGSFHGGKNKNRGSSNSSSIDLSLNTTSGSIFLD